MGRPLPGVDAAVVRRGDDGTVSVIEEPDVEGELALKPGWPSMFREYLHQEERYRNSFAGGFYLSGDLVKRDADGYLWFVGRADDVIKSAGHLIGPFEVENALTDHPAVAEAAVIGMPDPTVGEVVKAFVTLKDGFTADDALRRSLLGHARKRLVCPRATHPRSRRGRRRDGPRPLVRPVVGHGAGASDGGEVCRALQRGQDSRLPASVCRRGGGGRRIPAGVGGRGRGGGHLPRSRARPAAGCPDDQDHGRDVR